jgi:hypothetical protein
MPGGVRAPASALAMPKAAESSALMKALVLVPLVALAAASLLACAATSPDPGASIPRGDEAAGAAAPGQSARLTPQSDFRTVEWQIDPRPVLALGGSGSIDHGVVGDPCIVWDESVQTWRMFYFASGTHPDTNARGPRTAMALAASGEEIGPGDWTKAGLITFVNPQALINPDDYHKWWVVTDAQRPNHASKIDGRYWAVFTASKRMNGRMHKHLQAAWSTTLAGPWTLLDEPILAPESGTLDALHADTPSAFWFADRGQVGIFYKGYPTEPQAEQPRAPFGSGTILATWHPSEPRAQKVRILMRAGQTSAWNQGWMSSIQIFHDPTSRTWYGLHNGSPTPPADESHREPAPSLGGWVISDGHPLDGTWTPDEEHSPFLYPEDLTPAESAAGIGVNFWRHYLLVTPKGQVRIFFNSGTYGTEQMYSLVPR